MDSSLESTPLLGEKQGFNLQVTNERSISISVAAIFIVGTMCGSGILALPRAMVDSGWAGIPLLILCGLISAYTGNILGKCWSIVRKRYPEYVKEHTTDPYPTIAFRAAGNWGKQATRICIILTLFGSGVVFLLLIGGNIANLTKNLGDNTFHTCYLVLISAAFLLPLSWLGTPKDFWQAEILAAVSTTVAAIFIAVGLAVTPPDLPPPAHSNPSFESFFGAFGTILFAFGGASIFPTIQVDMKRPEKFPVSVVSGILVVLAIYIIVSVTGFVVIGDNMKETNILENMAPNWILYTVIILITAHLLLAFLIVINPVLQDIEGLLKIEDEFSWKRAVVRSVMMGLMTLVALIIPRFGVILSLAGATTMTATNFVFPPLFYILLSRQKSHLDGYGDLTVTRSVSTWVNFEVPLHNKLLLIEIMLIGIIGGAAGTYSVIASLIDGSSGFTVPCFTDWGSADP